MMRIIGNLQRWLLAALIAVGVLLGFELLAQNRILVDGPPGATVYGSVIVAPGCPVHATAIGSTCGSRPVVGATIVATLGDKTLRTTTGADGSYAITFVGWGQITITASEVRGLPGPPSPVTVMVNGGSRERVDLVYGAGTR